MLELAGYGGLIRFWIIHEGSELNFSWAKPMCDQRASHLLEFILPIALTTLPNPLFMSVLRLDMPFCKFWNPIFDWFPESSIYLIPLLSWPAVKRATKSFTVGMVIALW